MFGSTKLSTAYQGTALGGFSSKRTTKNNQTSPIQCLLFTGDKMEKQITVYRNDLIDTIIDGNVAIPCDSGEATLKLRSRGYDLMFDGLNASGNRIQIWSKQPITCAR